MNDNKIINKIMKYYEKYDNTEKEKYIDKVEKILLKNNKNDEMLIELFDQPEFERIIFELPTLIKNFNYNIQKKVVEKYGIEYFRFLSEDLKNDKEYIKSLCNQRISNLNIDMTLFFHLGEKLNNDPDYLISIQDISPRTFALSIDRVDYDEQTILDFFDKHPEELDLLPNNLKNNYNYVISLINKSDNPNCLSNLGFDYVRIPEIKNAIIKKYGNDTYKKIITYAIQTAEHQLSNKELLNLNIEELKEILLINPGLFEDKIGTYFLNDVEKKNLLLTTKKTASLTHDKVDTPEKVSQHLFELSNAFGKNLNYDQMYNWIKANWEQVYVWFAQINKYDDLGRVLKGVNIDSFYLMYNLLIGFEYNKLNEIFDICVSQDYRVSPHIKGIKDITVTKENLPFLQLICTTPIFDTESQNLEFYNKMFLKLCNLNKSPYEVIDFINSFSMDNNLMKIIGSLEIDKLDDNLLLNLFNYVKNKVNIHYKIENIYELNNFAEFINKNIDKISTNSLEDKANALLLQYFQISLKNANEILHSYLNSTENSNLYKIHPEVLYLKQLLEFITTIASIEEFENLKKQLDGNPKISYMDIDNIIKEIKKFYGNDLQQSLYKTEKNSGIIDVTDEKFNMLIHVTEAYGTGYKGSTYESWNTKEGRSGISICTSYISDNNMGIAYQGPNSVILGFNKLPEDYLELMSSEDLTSHGFSAVRESRFLTGDEMINNTRHTHNEVVIRRRQGTYTETKVQPSYIICFDDVNEKSKKAAQDFGIPILFIDREKVASRHHNELVAMVDQFKNTLDPNLIPIIISEQENNRSGLRMSRPEICEKYFGKEFRQNNINEIYNIINNGLINNHPNAINAMNNFAYFIKLEKKKYDDCKDHGSRESKFDLEVDEMLAAIEQHPNFKNEKIEKEELTPEQLYQKFMECREKVAANERDELALLYQQQKKQ